MMANAMPSDIAYAGIGLAFYGATDCSGDPTAQFNSTLVFPGSSWQKTMASGVAPDSSHAVAVRLYVGASSPPVAPKYAYSLFDNILLLSM
jgi:hypothetical protein